jgi:hypothetical protein
VGQHQGGEAGVLERLREQGVAIEGPVTDRCEGLVARNLTPIINLEKPLQRIRFLPGSPLSHKDFAHFSIPRDSDAGCVWVTDGRASSSNPTALYVDASGTQCE